MTNPFDRSGLAARSDIESAEWRALFAVMEMEQSRFLAKESSFRSAEYKWPRDPLHTWSRVWEYPYAYHHLREYLKTVPDNGSMPVVDLGSGVTFFPFAVAKLGRQVVCVDTDSVSERDINRARELIDCRPGGVTFRGTDGVRLPFADAETDVVYCISVLEHIPDPVPTIIEMARILRPRGRLILTLDLDLRGDQEIGVSKYRSLMRALLNNFVLTAPEQTVHPVELLRSDRGPYRAKPTRKPAGIFWTCYDSLRHMRPSRLLALIRPPFVLAVKGMVLAKKA